MFGNLVCQCKLKPFNVDFCGEDFHAKISFVENIFFQQCNRAMIFVRILSRSVLLPCLHVLLLNYAGWIMPIWLVE